VGVERAFGSLKGRFTIVDDATPFCLLKCGSLKGKNLQIKCGKIDKTTCINKICNGNLFAEITYVMIFYLRDGMKRSL
jgi:hypothetical protein